MQFCLTGIHRVRKGLQTKAHQQSRRERRATATPSLLSQIRLFRAGKEVFASKETAVTTSQISSGGGLVAVGTFRLGEALPTGKYFLQIIVVDKVAPIEKQLSDQWIDFEIVK